MQIRNKYQQMGVDRFYQENSNTYENPHEPIIHSHLNQLIRTGDISQGKILDLCCGTGQVTNFLKTKGFRQITGVDPYTNIEYQKRTNCRAYNFDFRYIAQKGLPEKYDVIICSFALHLCPESLLPQVLWALSQSCKKLIIISPNKKPKIKVFFEETNAVKDQRVFSKVYKAI